MKIGPGTVVLNQSKSRPCGGRVIDPPEDGAKDLDGFVWVQWDDKNIGRNGVCTELLEDLTLTAKVFFVDT